jgi:hypothetical protein
MSKYALAAFLFLYGITVILNTYVPASVVGVLAWAAAAALLIEAVKSGKQ